MGRSRWPMGFLKVGLDGKIEQLLWNRSAANIGLEGVGVVVRHGPGRVEVEREVGDEVEKGEGLEREVVLTWHGDVWEWEEEELRRRQELEREELADRGVRQEEGEVLRSAAVG